MNIVLLAQVRFCILQSFRDPIYILESCTFNRNEKITKKKPKWLLTFRFEVLYKSY